MTRPARAAARMGSRRRRDRRRPADRPRRPARLRALEDFSPSQINPRDPRTGVGQLANGRLVIVAVDGRQPGYSVGVTNFELAQLLVRLGAVTGTALDSGGSTTMAFNGKLLNRPSDPGGERAVADASTSSTTASSCRSRRSRCSRRTGTASRETQTLTYKLVRPSTVTASLVGPDGNPRADARPGCAQAGHVPIDWSAAYARRCARARGPLALGRQRASTTRASSRTPSALLPEQHARLPERQAARASSSAGAAARSGSRFRSRIRPS